MNAPETIAPPPNASAVGMLPIAEIVHSLSNPRRHFDGEYLAGGPFGVVCAMEVFKRWRHRREG